MDGLCDILVQSSIMDGLCDILVQSSIMDGLLCVIFRGRPGIRMRKKGADQNKTAC